MGEVFHGYSDDVHQQTGQSAACRPIVVCFQRSGIVQRRCSARVVGPAARRKFRVHMFIHVLSDLTDDALELILLQLVAVGDIIAAAATARHWRVICDVRWLGQRTAIDLRWEELVDAHFKWCGHESWGIEDLPSYEMYAIRSRLHKCAAVEPLDLQQMADQGVGLFQENERPMNNLQRTKLWEGCPGGDVDGFAFAFELSCNDKPVASWDGYYTDAYDNHEEEDGIRFAVPLFGLDEEPWASALETAASTWEIQAQFCGIDSGIDSADGPIVPPRDTVSLDIYVTHHSHTIKLYSGQLTYAKPWDDVDQLLFEEKALLCNGAETDCRFEGWLDLENNEVGTCTICFSRSPPYLHQYLPPYYHGHLEEKPNLTEQGLVRILTAYFEALTE